jgi:hypothetical protein
VLQLAIVLLGHCNLLEAGDEFTSMTTSPEHARLECEDSREYKYLPVRAVFARKSKSSVTSLSSNATSLIMLCTVG